MLDRPLSALRDLHDMLLPSGRPAGCGRVLAIAHGHAGAGVRHARGRSGGAVLRYPGFYLPGQIDLRSYLASFFATRAAKLRFIRIANDIEHNLASYLAIVTVINFALGMLAGFGAWLFGLPESVILGILAMVLNYVPYIGPACMTLILFVIGSDDLPVAWLRAVPHRQSFVALATIEGQFHDADDSGAPPHPQSARGAAGACVLVVAVGSDGDLPGRPAVDRRSGHDPPPVSVPRTSKLPG